MPDTLELEIATPERQLVNESVTEVQIPGKDGMLGILPGHAALLGLLGTGRLAYTSGGRKRSLAVQGGFLEVSPDHVRVLADVAERGEDIDVNKAKSDLAAAESQLTTDPDHAIPAAALAQARLDAAK
ncbi:MAG TPA: ATP synthase F1 subunit epsilon [Verrucomicrobiae bacterium]|nr:ATP synthase F1 subunit epsilon [Verrucomicrobiae bacterium]